MQDYTSKKYKLSWYQVKKITSIFARELKKEVVIQTHEGPIQALKGDFLCKGINNEQWAIKKEDLVRCYKPTGKTDGEWQEYEPDSSHCKLWAAELVETVEPDTQFGKLKGQKGDFILKETSPDSEVTLRYWIVNRQIFNKTYQKL